MIDWAKMFVKYVAKVEYCEGVSFLYETDWTPEEWAAIQEAVPDAD